MQRKYYPIDDREVLQELGYVLVTRKRAFHTPPCPAIATHDPLSVVQAVREYLGAEYYALDHTYENGWMYFYHL